jgi:hypothetical protein
MTLILPLDREPLAACKGERSPGPRPEADALGEEIDNAMRPEGPRDRWSRA